MTITEIAAGAGHTCARRRNGTVACWGSNDEGQLGVEPWGQGQQRPQAVAVPGLDGVIALGAGACHTCAVRYDGRTWCFGANSNGELGSPPLQARATPQPADFACAP